MTRTNHSAYTWFSKYVSKKNNLTPPPPSASESLAWHVYFRFGFYLDGGSSRVWILGYRKSCQMFHTCFLCNQSSLREHGCHSPTVYLDNRTKAFRYMRTWQNPKNWTILQFAVRWAQKGATSSYCFYRGLLRIAGCDADLRYLSRSRDLWDSNGTNISLATRTNQLNNNKRFLWLAKNCSKR